MFPKLSREKYIQGVKRAWKPLEASLIMTSQCFEYYQGLLQSPTEGLRNIFKCTDHVWFFEERSFKELGELVFREWTDSFSFKRSKEAILAREYALLAATDSEIDIFLKAYRAYTSTLFPIWRVEELVMNFVTKRIRTSHLSQSEADELLDALKIPLQDNLYKQEEFELVQTDDLDRHVEKFRWIYSRYGERNAYTTQQAIEKLKGLDKESFLKKYYAEKEYVHHAILQAKKLFKPEEAHFVDVLQFILYYRTQRTDIMHLATNLYYPRLEVYARDRGFSVEEAMHCHIDEFLGNFPMHEVLQKRIERQAFGFQDGKFEIMIDSDAQMTDQFFAEDFIQVDTLKGQIACRGIVRGRVVIFSSKEDMEKVKEGDILVASMTNPNHLPAMKKAAAFVTDEGGVTCHAAIVSRELGKPCIIGTKIATKVLKDGDEVEVDAEKGIVCKL